MGILTIQNKKIVLLAGDIVILYASLYLALMARYGDSFTDVIWRAHFAPFSIAFAIWLIIFYVAGLYDQKTSVNNYVFYTSLTTALGTALAVTIAIFYIIPIFGITPKTSLLLMALIFSALFLGWRYFYNSLMRSRHLSHNIICIGMNKEMREIIDIVSANHHFGYTIAEISETVGSGDIIREMIKKHNADTVVYLDNGATDLSNVLYNLIPLGIYMVDLQTFYAHITKKIPTSIIGEAWFLKNLIEIGKGFYEMEKRFSDVVLALVVGLLFLPFFPFIILAIALSSQGSIFYTQQRIGKNGRPFTLIKFRTMVANAEQNGIQWTKHKDDRITSAGNVLRKTRLDELPQLINILKGDMSFIGPRPERPEFVMRLEKEIPHYHMRHLVKPGLAGWAQLHQPLGGASVKDSQEKLQYDLYYIKNRSMIMDLDIIAKTIPIVIKREGH